MSDKRRKSSKPEKLLSKEQMAIAKWLEKVHFKKALFGVSEKDVWKKIAELDEMYQQALNAERIRYDALLEQQKKNEQPTAVKREVTG